MITLRTVSAVASSALVGLLVSGLATPAFGAQSVTCTDPGTTTQVDGSGLPFVFDNSAFSCNEVTVSNTTDVPVGDIVITQSVASSLNFDPPDGVVIDGARTGFEQTNYGTLIEYTGSATSGTIIVDFRRSATTRTQRFEITLGSGGGGGETPSGDAESTALVTGPGLHVQQFGMPESGTCDEAASDDLNWSGVESGGWGESWSQWINEGEGGAVCTRTLVYNTSQGAWEVD